MVLIRRKAAVPNDGQRASLGVAVAVVTLAAIAIVGGLIVGGLWWFGIGTRVGRSSTTVVSIIQLAFAFVAGVGGSVGLTVAYRKHLLEERAETREDSKHFNERFGGALAQLGSDLFAVKLGGVFAMASLADDWGPGRQQCIDVLCANIRRDYQPEPANLPEGSDVPAEQFKVRLAWKDNQEFRHTIIRVIAEHLRAKNSRPGPWCGYDFDFTDAVFDGGDLSGILVTSGQINFRGAQFSGGIADFKGVHFSGGSVDFRDAKFSGGRVEFGYAQFSGGNISFGGAEFSGSTMSFIETKFNGAYTHFMGARFSGGNLEFGGLISAGHVNFSGAEFGGGTAHFYATFAGGAVYFLGAKFSGGDVEFGGLFNGSDVDFSLAEFSSGTVDFSRAMFSSGTVVIRADAASTLPPFTSDQLAAGVIKLRSTPDTAA